MAINEILQEVFDLSKESFISEPRMVGGVVRDIYNYRLNEEQANITKSKAEIALLKDSFNNIVEIEGNRAIDVDITTDDSDSARLGILAADRLKKRFRMFSDGHVSVYFNKYFLDFSSYHISEEVVNYLKTDMGIADSSLFESYSRDFTINTLQKKFFSDEILDPTGQGLKDLEAKIIRTPVPAEITLLDDQRRIFRAIELSS